MGATGTRYEVRVGALVSRAALATFPVPVTPIAVPRHTVYRFRLPADRDLSDVLRRLTERDVQVVEIRRCAAPRAPRRARRDGAEAHDATVLPFPGPRRT